MRVSSRQRMILDLLLQKEEGMTVGEIAAQIEVSSRTVHRELTVIEKLLDEHDLKLVKKSGIGVQIQGDPERKEDLRLSLFHLTTTEYTAEERKVMILCTLLAAAEPVKVISLALDLNVTSATISHDLDDLEEWLQQYDLSLIRKRGYGIEIHGTEAAKRQVMVSLISDMLDENELIGMIKENIQNKSLRHVDSLSQRLLGFIDKEKLMIVENTLQHLDKELAYPLADSAYMGLAIHLALAIERIEKGESISFDQKTLSELKNTKEYKIAEQIVERLRHMFQLDIPAAEVGYVTMHLRGAKLRSSQEELFWSANVELIAKIRKFIQLCEEKLNISLAEDSSLFHGLLTHMEPALYRVRQGMKIRNPLLEQIRADYPILFAVIKEVVNVTFPDLAVPDEEIGYLVMHIGSAIERADQEHKRFRAFIVCSSGIGSSKILATRIKKEIPEIDRLQNLSLFEVGSIPRHEYDLIISTIPLPMDPNDYIMVTPLLSKDDLKKIRSAIGTRKKTGWLHTQAGIQARVNRPIQKMKSLQRFLCHAIDLMDDFFYRKVDNEERSTEEILREACDVLREKGIISDSREVVRQLLERQEIGGLGIPSTNLALFHARNEAVLRISFSICSLRKPVVLKSMDEQDIQITKIALLLGPKDTAKEGLEVLSEISALLIEEKTIEIVETEDEKQIADYFSEQLYHRFSKKIEMER
ncbi:MAG: transcription antiterminator [Brevibacillus sp.]|nr:transcription antiterminator [Brevibacillus sp.]